MEKNGERQVLFVALLLCVSWPTFIEQVDEIIRHWSSCVNGGGISDFKANRATLLIVSMASFSYYSVAYRLMPSQSCCNEFHKAGHLLLSTPGLSCYIAGVMSWLTVVYDRVVLSLSFLIMLAAFRSVDRLLFLKEKKDNKRPCGSSFFFCCCCCCL